MGCPDEFKDKCPSCGRTILIQSKLFNNRCLIFNLGDKVEPENDSPQEFLAKFPCPECGEFPVIVTRDKHFVGFQKGFSAGTTTDKHIRELGWGRVCMVIENDD
jgi:predicted RNA-binding Zn-ribbon protein involved in translation (DUF1610 family)